MIKTKKKSLKLLKELFLPCGRPSPSLKKKSEEDQFEFLKKKLSAFCTEKMLNKSETREKIIRALLKEGKHFTALDILNRLQKISPEIGKATLYRSLPIFIESGLIQEGPLSSEGQILYEIVTEEEHHDHIICVDCRQVFEFHDPQIEKKQDELTKNMKFRLQKHSHVIFASCEFKKHKNE